MRKTRTIGRRVGVGFGLVALALGIVAGGSIFGLKQLTDGVSETVACNTLRSEILQKEVDHLKWAKQVSDLLVDKEATKLAVQTDPRLCAFGKWYYSDERAKAEQLVPGINAALTAIEGPHKHLHESAIEIDKCFVQADLTLSTELKQLKVDHVNWARQVMDALLDANKKQTDVQTNSRLCGFGKWYYSEHVQSLRKESSELDKILAAIEEPHNKLHASAVEINKLLASGDRQAATAYYNEHAHKYANDTCAELDKVIAWNDARTKGLLEAKEIFTRKTTPALKEVQQLLGEIGEKTAKVTEAHNEHIHAQAGTTRATVIGVSLAGIAAAVVLAVLIVRSTSRVLRKVSAELNEGADQVNDAAQQVSSASQSLAAAASEQASSLEETSSAMEEMAAMTRTNAENSQKASDLSTKARDAADHGGVVVGQLNEAMGGIQEASEQVGKIIKVIEEIAFQTNLLALNAAVEAARAGEHGKGFAVVADEVRNLAQRAAGASKEITDLIASSTDRSKKGAQIAEEVSSVLGGIMGDVKEVTTLIEGIARASGEQAQGVDQINTAVSQMDRVTQQTASGAEESAAAAEELAAQATAVKNMVQELSALAGGSDHDRTREVEPTPVTHPHRMNVQKVKKPVQKPQEYAEMTMDDQGF